MIQIISKIEELHKLSKELGVSIEGNTDTLKEKIYDKLDQEKRSLKDIEQVIGSKQLEKKESHDTLVYKQSQYLELKEQLSNKEKDVLVKRKRLQQKTQEAENHTRILLSIEFKNRIGKLNSLLNVGMNYTQGKELCEKMDDFINSMIPIPIFFNKWEPQTESTREKLIDIKKI